MYIGSRHTIWRHIKEEQFRQNLIDIDQLIDDKYLTIAERNAHTDEGSEDMKERTMTFSINGDFITRLAREKCHYEGKMEYAMTLLESCLESDEIRDNERKKGWLLRFWMGAQR